MAEGDRYTLRPCEGPDCSTVFEPKQPHQKYHHESCRKAAHHERRCRRVEERIMEAVGHAVREHL